MESSGSRRYSGKFQMVQQVQQQQTNEVHR